MTLAATFLALESDLAAVFGQSATLKVPAQVYDTDGTVVETVTTATVTVEGPVDEANRYRGESTDQRVSATFYVPALDLVLVPSPASRLTIGARTWQVYASVPYSMNGTVTSWRVDCGEVV